MAPRRPLALLVGGPSDEHEVSLETGATMLSLLRDGGHAVRPVLVGRDRRWTVGEAADALADLTGRTPRDEADALADLAAAGELAVLALHGRFGEDGTVQRLLAGRGIPFTGSAADASELAMDKVRSKALAERLGAPVAPHAVARPGQAPDAPPPPCIVKPVRGGSSVALTLVRAPEELDDAIRRAAGADPGGEALVEGFVPGRELSLPVLRLDGVVRTLPLLAIAPADGRLYDYHAKYEAEDTVIECPASVPRRARGLVEQLGVALYETLGLRGVARFDFRLEERSATPRFLELNTLPGFTSHSLVPRSAREAGISAGAVLEAVLADAAS